MNFLQGLVAALTGGHGGLPPAQGNPSGAQLGPVQPANSGGFTLNSKPGGSMLDLLSSMMHGGGQSGQQLSVGGRGVPVQPVDGSYPQNAGGKGELGMDNLLQPSYQNPQGTLNGGFQQGGMPQGMGLQPGADPLGWQAGR